MPSRTSRKAREQAASDLLFASQLERSGLLAEAELKYRAVLASDPHEWRALHQLGSLCLAKGELIGALDFMAAAMKANPASAEAKSNHGFILQKLNRHDEALEQFSRALVAQPGYVPALLNRGTSLYHLGRLTEALASFDRALGHEPKNLKALYNRANILHELRRFDESLAAFSATLAVDPGFADAQWNEALTRLLLGDFERGWKQYEWRWQTESQRHLRRDFAQPLWLGDAPLGGRAILIHAEQGFGDTIQFARYLPRLVDLGADVVFEVQPELAPLLSTMAGPVRLVKKSTALPDFDLHCPVMSLPLAFGTILETIPWDGPYVKAPSARLDQWRERLGPRDRRRVALAWAGSATHKQDRVRSVPLETLLPLIGAAPDIQWISLQRDLRAGDGDKLNSLPNVRNIGPELTDFADTAAVLSQCDLAITVDTAVAHLAGALGCPLWVLLQYSPDFRWMIDRDDSPWYPTARLFRQHALHDWNDVIARVTAAIAT